MGLLDKKVFAFETLKKLIILRNYGVFVFENFNEVFAFETFSHLRRHRGFRIMNWCVF